MNPFQGQRKSTRRRKVSSVLSGHFVVPEIPGFSSGKADIVVSGSVPVVEANVVGPVSDSVEITSDPVDVPDAENAQDVVLHVVEGSAGETGDVLAEGVRQTLFQLPYQ